MSIPTDVLNDVRWAKNELQKSNFKKEEIISVLDGIIKRGETALPRVPEPIYAPVPDIQEIKHFATELELFDDDLYELIFADQFSNNFVAGDEAPVKTPLKQKRPAPVDVTLEDDDSMLFAKPEVTAAPVPSIPIPSAAVSYLEASRDVSHAELEKSKNQLKERYSRSKVVELKSMCEDADLPKVGRKQELINRLVDYTIKSQYGGSPRMRNSYQTAMASPLAPERPAAAAPPRPDSAMSQSSLRSENSTTSIKSNKSTASSKVKKDLKRPIGGASNRFRSPSPNNEPAMARTPSFRAKLTNKFQNSPLMSPRTWKTSTSSLSLKHKTPSKADLEAKVTFIPKMVAISSF